MPMRFRFVASPRLKACHPCLPIPVLLRAGRITFVPIVAKSLGRPLGPPPKTKALPKLPVSAAQDPLEVLAANAMTTSDLIPVPGKTEFSATRDGCLTPIVNDAVLSPYSQSKDSKEFYEAIRMGVENLSQNSQYRVPLETLPLVFYSEQPWRVQNYDIYTAIRQ